MCSLKSPCRTFYLSYIETIALSCLVIEKIAFLCTRSGDRQAVFRSIIALPFGVEKTRTKWLSDGEKNRTIFIYIIYLL